MARRIGLQDKYKFCHLPRRIHPQRSCLIRFQTQRGEPRVESGGTNANLSWNCGFEGATVSPAVYQLRMRQIRNLLALTLLSVGTPMLLMGDEVCEPSKETTMHIARTMQPVGSTGAYATSMLTCSASCGN